jgi:hypothetical protein
LDEADTSVVAQRDRVVETILIVLPTRERDVALTLEQEVYLPFAARDDLIILLTASILLIKLTSASRNLNRSSGFVERRAARWDAKASALRPTMIT